MSSSHHTWLGDYEISSTTCSGLTFARHSHDECVIGVNLIGEEKVWLDRRTFEAGPGSITLYNPGRSRAAARPRVRPGTLSVCTPGLTAWPPTWGWRTWSLIAHCVLPRLWRRNWRRPPRAH